MMSDPTTITVRSNLHLWLLTGRSNDFFNPSLNTGVVYSTGSTPPEVQVARKLLELDSRTTDFHVLAVLAATKMSTAFIRTLPHENDAVFVPGLLTLPPVTSSRPMLNPDAHSLPSIDGGRAGRDGFSRLTVRGIGSGQIEAATDRGHSTTLPCNVSPEGDSYRLSVPGLVDFGVRAHFLVPEWEQGSELSIQFSPTRYPFKKVAESILQDGNAKRLMTHEGTLAAFAETSNAAVKVGVMGLAIIRRMVKQLNGDQIGFRVSTATGSTLDLSYSIDPVFDASLATPEVDAKAPTGFDV